MMDRNILKGHGVSYEMGYEMWWFLILLPEFQQVHLSSFKEISYQR